MFDGMNVKPLIIAGGGGGFAHEVFEEEAYLGNTATRGRDASGEINGDRLRPFDGGKDGGKGDEYECEDDHGGGASGFLEDGCSPEDPPKSFISNYQTALAGAEATRETARGGFGGGGHGGESGAGGGGGYSGGGSYRHHPGVGGGGGSFIHAEAENPATSDGNWETTGSEPHDVYQGNVEDLEEWNDGHGKIIVEKIDSDFCDFRGPNKNECIMNETNQLQEREYNVSSIFESRSNAVFEAFQGPATLTIDNTTSISGLWKGQINIETESPRITSGAEFRPENERIVIGN